MQKTTIIGFLGTTLDVGKKDTRWERWRPTVSLFMNDEFKADKLVLLYDRRYGKLFNQVKADIESLSPATTILGETVHIKDPWDFAEMYGVLYDFVRGYAFESDHEYLLHITTGTHVAQICWYLLIDAHYLPAKIIQSSPTKNYTAQGEYRIIDLDLQRYDNLKARFDKEQLENFNTLKANIATNNSYYNQLITQIEKVAIRSNSPILLTGETGVGKSQLARQLFLLKQDKFKLTGQFIDVNCATLKGDSAMSALFGHIKGAFTGANGNRDGYLKSAHNGILFLDEIGELGLDEQAMLLKAIEEKSFFAVGSDKQVHSDFLLIAGTNKDLRNEVKNGNFRGDLWARLNTWVFRLPSLKERTEDILPNIEFELKKFALLYKRNIKFYQDALNDYLAFATSKNATWQGNFRDLTASIHRMATLSDNGYIDKAIVQWEINTLLTLWQGDTLTNHNNDNANVLIKFFDDNQLSQLDEFDKIQLTGVLQLCLTKKSMADAGRQLFAHSRLNKASHNDSDRVKKYLARFDLTWADIERIKKE